MLQNPRKTLGLKKNMVYKIPPGGEVNHIQPVAYSFHNPLKTLKLKTLASDCVIKRDVTTVPFLIYYDELYMLHPLKSTLILET